MPSSLELRRDLAGLTRLAGRNLDALWRELGEDVRSGDALHDLLPELVEKFGAAAATVTADWYDDLRDERLIRGAFTAIPADIPDSHTDSLIGWAGRTASDEAAFRMKVLGGTTRRILNFSRQTVMGSSVADPRAKGWQRIGVGECDFCQMLLSRGAVYTEATADFEAHDHCHCSAEPAW